MQVSCLHLENTAGFLSFALRDSFQGQQRLICVAIGGKDAARGMLSLGTEPQRVRHCLQKRQLSRPSARCSDLIGLSPQYCAIESDRHLFICMMRDRTMDLESKSDHAWHSRRTPPMGILIASERTVCCLERRSEEQWKVSTCRSSDHSTLFSTVSKAPTECAAGRMFSRLTLRSKVIRLIRKIPQGEILWVSLV